MRVRLIFNLKNIGGMLPHYHQNILVEWLEQIKDQTGIPNDTMYHFSGIKGKINIQPDGLHYYSDKVTLVLSFVQEDSLKALLQTIFKEKTWQVGGLLLEPAWVEKETGVPTFQNSMKYICISPIVPAYIGLNDEAYGQSFIPPLSENFSDLLYDCTMERMEATGTYSADTLQNLSTFQLVPDQSYLDKLKIANKKFARIYPIQYQQAVYSIRGYTLPFMLYADKIVQNFIYAHGLGAFTKQGLGMIDVAASHGTRQWEPYELPS